MTCSMFTACSFIMLAYALAHNHDLYFTIAGFINVTGWTSILSLATFNRHLRHEKAEDHSG